MTLDQKKCELTMEILEACVRSSRANDLDKVEKGVCLLEKLGVIGLASVSAREEPSPRQDNGQDAEQASHSPGGDTLPENPEPKSESEEFDLEAAIEYTKNKIPLDEEELIWLNKVPTCKGGEPKADKIHFIEAGGIRKAMKNGKIRGYQPDADYRYFRYSILLHKHEVPDPWGGLIGK